MSQQKIAGKRRISNIQLSESIEKRFNSMKSNISNEEPVQKNNKVDEKLRLLMKL